MPRVLYVSTTSQVGGAEESLLTLLAHLDRDAVTPLLVCPPVDTDNGGAPDASASGEAPLVQNLSVRAAGLDVAVVHVPLRRLRRSWNPLRLARTWQDCKRCREAVREVATREQVDVIHANSLSAALQADGAPLICHMRDLGLPRLAAWLLRSRVQAVVGTSQAVCDLGRRRFGGKVRRIPNGVDPEQFRPGRAAGGGAPYVLMIGHMVPWKRHDLFLECLAEVRARDASIEGVVVGADLFADHTDHVARLMERARDLGLHHAVTWKAGVSRDEIAALIAGALVLVHPTPVEPFGRAVLEAMACATPVVAVDAGGPRELLARGGGVRLASGDVSGMAHAVLDYLVNPQRAREHGQRGREAVLAEYTASAHAKAVMAMYRELLGQA